MMFPKNQLTITATDTIIMLSTHTGVNRLKLVLLILASALAGCANLDQYEQRTRYGYLPHDTCIPCGAKPIGILPAGSRIPLPQDFK
jgi:hypothetical protein